MSKKSKKQEPVPQPFEEPRAKGAFLKHALILSGIAILSCIVFGNSLQGQINVWDDVQYIQDNTLIKGLSWQGIQNIFSRPVMGNYHPLTILSYAFEYHFVQLDPWLYHFDNLLLHMAVTVLVYCFIYLLSGRIAVAVVTAVLFAIHPMHVESVAWAAARKDLLYGLFYIGACIGHIYYIRSKKVLQYMLVLTLFVLALLSKPVAVTLPFALLLIDLLLKRQMNRGVFLEKVPHFALSLLCGIAAIRAQNAAGAMSMVETGYNIIDKISVTCYSLLVYLWKAVVPTGLHTTYYYPIKTGSMLPVFYYTCPLLIVAACIVIWKRFSGNRIIVFGFLFFLLHILPVLQVIQVGDSMLAERYSYLPYLGLFFVAGWYLSPYFEKEVRPKYSIYILALLVLYTGTLCYASNRRTKDWNDSISLWTAEIAAEPQRAIKAYNNLGYNYYLKWANTPDPTLRTTYHDSAYYLLTTITALDPKATGAYVILGEMENNAGNPDAAIAFYHKGLAIKPEADLCIGLAVLYFRQDKLDSSGYYFRQSLRLKPTSESHGNYAIYLEKVEKTDSAIIEYDYAVQLNPANPSHYLNRGRLHRKLDHWPEAASDFEIAIRLAPELGEAYYQRSFCDTQRHDRNKAIEDVNKAISLGFNQVDPIYHNSLLK